MQDSASVGLKGVCPRCGQGRLFRGPFSLSLKEGCTACGLDYASADIGDGAVVPVMMLANFVVLGFALWLHFSLGAPWWVHLLVTLPFALLVVGGALRFMKGWLFAQQLRHEAAPGRLDR